MQKSFVYITSIVCLTLLILGVFVTAALTLDGGDYQRILAIIVPTLVAAVPAVFAAIKADEANAAIHNGVIKDKVREALDEHNTGSVPVVKDENNG